MAVSEKVTKCQDNSILCPRSLWLIAGTHCQPLVLCSSPHQGHGLGGIHHVGMALSGQAGAPTPPDGLVRIFSGSLSRDEEEHGVSRAGLCTGVLEKAASRIGVTPAPLTSLLQAGREAGLPHLPCCPNPKQPLRFVRHDLISASLPREAPRGAFVCGARRQTDSSREAPVNHGPFQPVTSGKRGKRLCWEWGLHPSHREGTRGAASQRWLRPCVDNLRFW